MGLKNKKAHACKHLCKGELLLLERLVLVVAGGLFADANYLVVYAVEGIESLLRYLTRGGLERFLAYVGLRKHVGVANNGIDERWTKPFGGDDGTQLGGHDPR